MNAQGITAALPDGVVEALAVDQDYRMHTSDGRAFQLDQTCANVPEPTEEPPGPGLPEVEPDPVECRKPS